MESKLPGPDTQTQNKQPFPVHSSSYTYFADQDMNEGLCTENSVGGSQVRLEVFGRPVDMTREIHPELEKERIRERIMAEEVYRKFLEMELRRELMIQSDSSGCLSSSMLGSWHSHNNRFERGMLRTQSFAQKTHGSVGHDHGGIGGFEAVPFQQSQETTTTSLPENGKIKYFIGLGNPCGASLSAKQKSPSSSRPPAGSSKLHSEKTKDKWSCAMCKVSATCECDFNEHLSGKKHKAKMVALRRNINTGPSKLGSKKTKDEWRCVISMIIAPCECGLNKRLLEKKLKAKMAALRPHIDTGSSKLGSKKTKDEWSCEICKISATCERGLYEQSGKKHKAKTAAQTPHINTSSSKLGSEKTKDEWSCEICKISATCERGLNEHLSGKKHKAKMAELRPHINTGAEIGKGKSQLVKAQPLVVMKNSSEYVSIGSKEDSVNKGESTSHMFRYWCEMCKAGALSELDMNKHKKGKKHLKNLLKPHKEKTPSGASLCAAKQKSPSPSPPSAGSCKLGSKKTKDEWGCEICKISATCERGLNEHLSGKKHKAKTQS